jgi:hypothetical protein
MLQLYRNIATCQYTNFRNFWTNRREQPDSLKGGNLGPGLLSDGVPKRAGVKNVWRPGTMTSLWTDGLWRWQGFALSYGHMRLRRGVGQNRLSPP